ncbi:hypothetical protein A2U01_0049414, partial [Trifolium medium]|nr:hypothetical protein [Trifolium medium]
MVVPGRLLHLDNSVLRSLAIDYAGNPQAERDSGAVTYFEEMTLSYYDELLVFDGENSEDTT